MNNLEDLKRDLLLQRGDLFAQKASIETNLLRIEGALALTEAQIKSAQDTSHEPSQDTPR